MSRASGGLAEAIDIWATADVEDGVPSPKRRKRWICESCGIHIYARNRGGPKRFCGPCGHVRRMEKTLTREREYRKRKREGKSLNETS